MAENKKIPVLTVWKNNVILKNIFLVNSPPPLLIDSSSNNNNNGGYEEILMVGRHPECDIRLEHPSVSRFHLRIHSLPSSFTLSLTDLNSVHGTFVSGKRLEPNVRTVLKEGDTMRIGASSRVYKLHWIPFHQAYDMDHPFVPPLDYPEPQEDEDEENIFKDASDPVSKNEDMGVVDSVSKPLESLAICDGDEIMVEENNKLAEKDDTELVDSGFDGLESLFSDGGNEDFIQKDTEPAPSMQNLYREAFQSEDGSEMDSILECLVPLFLGENWEWIGKEKSHLESLQVNDPLPLKYEDDGYVASVLKGSDVQKVIPLAAPLLDKVACVSEPKLDNTVTDGKSGGELVGALNQANEKQNPLQDMQESMWNFWDEPVTEPCSPAIKGVLVKDDGNENICSEFKTEPKSLSQRKYFERDTVVQNSSTKKHGSGRLWSFWSGNMGIESDSENGSVRKDFWSPWPQSSVKKPLDLSIITPERNSGQSITSRIGKQESNRQVSTNRTEGKTPKTDRKNAKDAPFSRALFHGVDDKEEDNEIFTPDKENLTPNTHKSLRKFAMLNEIKYSNTSKSSLSVMPESPDIVYENGVSLVPDKENIPSKAQREWDMRVPFQSLLADSPICLSISRTYHIHGAMRSENSVCFPEDALEEKWSKGKSQKWNMIVDTTTLVNKESRKGLELLEGLKGTQLIIPRIVIRELDSLKGQTSLFRRNTEVSSALEWVQDRMIKAPEWIHVQSCVDKGMSVAPTPPTSPLTQFSYGALTSTPVFGSRPEILSPTSEDYVLEYALSFRNKTQDGHLVLLSNDITLKINAMAEGLICEEAGDFRDSLVNPFSERFLWPDSSPRGQTWSCSDDFVLREKFYPSSLKMTPKAIDNVKGLKLILHNSQYLSARLNRDLLG